MNKRFFLCTLVLFVISQTIYCVGSRLFRTG
jgi:hypothetical protein